MDRKAHPVYFGRRSVEIGAKAKSSKPLLSTNDVFGGLVTNDFIMLMVHRWTSQVLWHIKRRS
jgi:hypothetical protein